VVVKQPLAVLLFAAQLTRLLVLVDVLFGADANRLLFELYDCDGREVKRKQGGQTSSSIKTKRRSVVSRIGCLVQMSESHGGSSLGSLSSSA
jgi:hypothetical protein